MYDQLYVDSMRHFLDLFDIVEDHSRLVPACPDYTIRDLLAHCVAKATGYANGHAELVCDPMGTDPGVAARTGRTATELVEEWQRAIPAIRAIPVDSGRWFVIANDMLGHDADLRAALGTPQLPTDTLAVLWPLVQRQLTETLAPLGTVRFDLHELTVDLGPAADPDVVVETSLFELWRGVFGRRDRNQIRAWVRTGPADEFTAVLPICAPRQTELLETA